jgi:hypothetical protein
MNTLIERIKTYMMNVDFPSFVQGLLAIIVTVGCFVSWVVWREVPEWAVSMLVLIYGFFFGARFGSLSEKNKRTNGNES